MCETMRPGEGEFTLEVTLRGEVKFGICLSIAANDPTRLSTTKIGHVGTGSFRERNLSRAFLTFRQRQQLLHTW